MTRWWWCFLIVIIRLVQSIDESLGGGVVEGYDGLQNSADGEIRSNIGFTETQSTFRGERERERKTSMSISVGGKGGIKALKRRERRKKKKGYFT